MVPSMMMVVVVAMMVAPIIMTPVIMTPMMLEKLVLAAVVVIVVVVTIDLHQAGLRLNAPGRWGEPPGPRMSTLRGTSSPPTTAATRVLHQLALCCSFSPAWRRL